MPISGNNGLFRGRNCKKKMPTWRYGRVHLIHGFNIPIWIDRITIPPKARVFNSTEGYKQIVHSNFGSKVRNTFGFNPGHSRAYNWLIVVNRNYMRCSCRPQDMLNPRRNRANHTNIQIGQIQVNCVQCQSNIFSWMRIMRTWNCTTGGNNIVKFTNHHTGPNGTFSSNVEV